MWTWVDGHMLLVYILVYPSSFFIVCWINGLLRRPYKDADKDLE